MISVVIFSHRKCPRTATRKANDCTLNIYIVSSEKIRCKNADCWNDRDGAHIWLVHEKWYSTTARGWLQCEGAHRDTFACEIFCIEGAKWCGVRGLWRGVPVWASIISSFNSNSVTSFQWRVSEKEYGSSLPIAGNQISDYCLLSCFLSFSAQEDVHSSSKTNLILDYYFFSFFFSPPPLPTLPFYSLLLICISLPFSFSLSISYSSSAQTDSFVSNTFPLLCPK